MNKEYALEIKVTGDNIRSAMVSREGTFEDADILCAWKSLTHMMLGLWGHKGITNSILHTELDRVFATNENCEIEIAKEISHERG